MTIPEEERKKSPSNMTIRFHIFKYISKFSNHGICPLKYGKTCKNCNKLNSDDEQGKIYTNKELAVIKEPM